VFKRYLTPELRARKLIELTPTDIQEWINALTARGLGARTIRLAHATVRACLNRAVKLDKIPRNVARAVDLPRHSHVERVVFSPTEARRFLEAAKGDRWEAFFSLQLHAGLRPGEALGLLWSDLEGSVLRIRRALIRVPHQPLQLAATKTGKSRSIPLGAETLEALRKHRVAQIEGRLLLGASYDDRGLIFANEMGGFADDHNIICRHFKPILRRARLRHMRLYDLRHSCATLLLAAGEHPKVVQERLGHSSIAMTLDVYSHVIPGMQESASQRLESLLSAREPSAVSSSS
jgi:integrase